MNVDNFDVADLMAAAKVAEVAERFEDMCSILNKLVTEKCVKNETLNVEERNSLSVAYKNVVGTKRQSWRMLTQANFPDLEKNDLDQYTRIIEKELEAICGEVNELLVKATKVAKDNGAVPEDVVFYLKMSGDYYRYLSEFKTDSDDCNKAAKFYEEAVEVAKENLAETHPTRLGLALNYSVCCYEILDKKDRACEIAKEAFDSAIEKLETLNDSSYKDSTLIMQLLRDNLTLWTSEKEEQEDE